MAGELEVPEECAGLVDVVDFVAMWLPDRTPLAATARFARCAVHFRSYLVASAAFTTFRCFSCGNGVRCIVRGHHHIDQGFIVYEGIAPNGVDPPEVWYAWLPMFDAAACHTCVERLGFDPWTWWVEEQRRRFEDEIEEVADRVLDMIADADF